MISDAVEDWNYTLPQEQWPRVEKAEPIENGQAIGILLREYDGTISAVRIGIEQLAD